MLSRKLLLALVVVFIALAAVAFAEEANVGVAVADADDVADADETALVEEDDEEEEDDAALVEDDDAAPLTSIGWYKNKRDKRDGRLQKATYEKGFCVTKQGRDVNDKVQKMKSHSGRGKLQQIICAQLCHRVKGATAAEVIWNQGNKGCYCHKSNLVSKGNGVPNHKCMVFAKAATIKTKRTKKERAHRGPKKPTPKAAPSKGKNAAYGKRSHNSLIGHIRQIERELNHEKKQVNSAAHNACTKNTRSNVRLVRHGFATDSKAFGVVGCRRGSRCDRVSKKNIRNMKSEASCVVWGRNLIKANRRKVKLNGNIIRSNHQAIRRTKNRSAKLTREYNVEKRNHKEAESVLTAVRKRLRRNGKLVFTEQEEKVLGVAFLEVVEDLKRTKQRGSVNRLIKLIEKLIRDFNAKEGLLDKAQRLQLSNKRNLIRTKNADTARRNGQNRRLSISTRTTAVKQRGCQNRFNSLHKVMRTFPQNCVKAHKVFKATMADIIRELRVIADIKNLVNRRGGALKKIKAF